MAKITALNTISGQVAEVNQSALKHPVFSQYLVEVPEGTKSFSPDKYKPQTVEEYLERQAQKDAAAKEAAKKEKAESAKASAAPAAPANDGKAAS